MADVYALLDEWLANVKDDELKAELVALKESGDEDAITDAFFQDLEFGMKRRWKSWDWIPTIQENTESILLV